MTAIMDDFASFSIIPFGTNTSLPLDDLYVDTNCWMDIALKRPGWRIAEQYLVRFVGSSADNYLLWSPHTDNEVMQCFHVDGFVNEANSRGVTRRGNKAAWKVLEGQLDRAEKLVLGKMALQGFDTIKGMFADVLYPIELIDIMPTTRKIIDTYGVPFKDAQHLAYMWHEETNNLFTRDKDFTTVPGLNLYSGNILTNGNPPFPISAFMPELTEHRP